MKNKIIAVIKKHSESFFVTGAFLIAIVLCFFKIARNSLTLDEVNTLVISRNLATMIPILWNDEANMWFYHLIMNEWLRLGNSEFILRSASAIFGTLSVPFFYKFAKDIVGKRTAKIATLLVTFNLYFLFYAQTARSYSLSLLLTLIFSYCFYKLIDDTRSHLYLVAYIIMSSLAIYTYLLTGLVVATQCITLLFLPKPIPWKKIVLAITGIFVCLLPLIISPAFHGPQMDWLQKPYLIHLPMAIIMLGGDSLIVTFLSLLVIGSLLLASKKYFLLKNRKRFILVWMLLWAGFPIFFGFTFSLLVKPIFEPESFNTSLPAFVILVAIGLEKLKKTTWIYSTILTLIFVFSGIRIAAWYSNSIQPQLVIENRNSRDWRMIASYIKTNEKESDGIIFYSYYIHNPFEYYFENSEKFHKAKVIEMSSAKYPINGGTVLPEPDLKLIDNLFKKYQRIWLIESYNNFAWLKRDIQTSEIEVELSSNFKLKEVKQFSQVKIKLFERVRSEVNIIL